MGEKGYDGKDGRVVALKFTSKAKGIGQQHGQNKYKMKLKH